MKKNVCKTCGYTITSSNDLDIRYCSVCNTSNMMSYFVEIEPVVEPVIEEVVKSEDALIPQNLETETTNTTIRIESKLGKKRK